MNREMQLRRRIKALTWLFIIGLVLSGATAIPLRWELDSLIKLWDAEELGSQAAADLDFVTLWLFQVRNALDMVEYTNPFLAYGTDWLAFGHFVIAIAFVGALRDPVRNRWLFDFGLIACALVIPYALVFGAVRGIPFWWRLIDCSFGVSGFLPLWLCRKWAKQLAELRLEAS
ncbi:MAG: hypothetical protein MUF81_12750 [Verrucomicrobia bacterium]|jgi:hypothetical protein|nr:hypothetical protein [Verrucomicrobiota bacterium]